MASTVKINEIIKIISKIIPTPRNKSVYHYVQVRIMLRAPEFRSDVPEKWSGCMGHMHGLIVKPQFQAPTDPGYAKPCM